MFAKLTGLVSAVVLAAALGTSVAAEEAQDPWKELFTDGLVDADGQAVSLAQLKGKIVALYFSAHWCPPCRQFTPKLVEFRDKNAEHFEVVFISSDRTKADKAKYMTDAKMKWPSVDFGVPSVKALKTKYKVSGIPQLVVLGPNGDTIAEDGRMQVSTAPDTCLAAWQKAAGIAETPKKAEEKKTE
jgi:thiol-disulfide isomerase/thioredoxin